MNKGSVKLALAICVLLFGVSESSGQKKRPPTAKPAKAVAASKELGQSAVVLDETLSVLRATPSLFADNIQRMRRGREVKILGVQEADGVRFYKITADRNFGWIQADSVFAKFRVGDEERLARLVQASNGFEQLEIAAYYFTLYPTSKFRPAILLLFGDLCQEAAVKLSRDATSRLDRREMAASGAPLHSFYLNYVGLDRYRKLGILYKFNASTKQYYYNGGSWIELLEKFPNSAESAEAKKRIDSIRERADAKATK